MSAAHRQACFAPDFIIFNLRLCNGFELEVDKMNK